MVRAHGEVREITSDHDTGRDVESAADAAITPVTGASREEQLTGLIRGIAGGSQDAMAAFYERTVDRAHAVARSILRVDEDAEEAMMEAYLQVWRTAHRYLPSKANPTTWLLMMVRSRALDLHRRRAIERERNVPMDASPEVEDEACGPDALLDILDRSSAVAGALKQLTQAQREVITLGFFRDLSHVQIAASLGIPLGTVKSHARRAVIAMRAHLEAAG